MQRTWTRSLWQVSAAAGLSAACWMWSAVGGLAQVPQDTPAQEQDRQTTTRRAQTGQRTQDDDTQGVGRSQSGTYSNRPGTSDYSQSQSPSRSAQTGTGQTGTGQSGFGSTQTGRARSDAQSGSEYNYGVNPGGAFQSNQFGASRDSRSDQSGYAAGASSRDRNRESQDTRQDTRDSLRDTARQAREDFQDTRDETRDAIGEARDDMRGTARGARDQSQDSRSSRDEAQRRLDRDELSDESQTQGVSRSQRDFSRDDDRSGQDFSRRDSQRDFSRDSSQRDFSQRDDREFSRGQQRDDFDDQRQFSRDQRSEQRDFARDEDSDRFQQDRFQQDRFQQDSSRREGWQDDRRSQSARMDQRDWQDDSRGRASADFRSSTSSRTQVSRSADIGIWFDRGTRDSLVISDIASSGPITRFGFREGDRIISVNGTRVTSERQFIDYLLSPRTLNQRAQVIVWRNNQQSTIWVEPWVLVQETTTVSQTDPLEVYGVILDDRYSYPVVWRVLPRSPAFYAGIRSGDVIVAWSGQYVYNPDDLVTLVQQSPGEQINVQVSRNRQLRQVTLDAGDTQWSRTALRPDYDQTFDSRDAIGAPADQGFRTRSQTDLNWQQQGTFQGGAGFGQRTGAQLRPGATYGQTTTSFGQQPGVYYTQPGAYGQAGGYVQPGMTTGQPSGGLLPRLRGR